MVECASDKLQNDLIAHAMSLEAKADTMKVLVEENGRKVHYQMIDNNPCLVHHYTCMDLDIEDVKKFFADFAGNMMKILPDNAKYTMIDDVVNGKKMALHRMTPGVPLVATRSMICTYFPIDNGEEFTFIVSSQGNEEILAKHAKLLEGDVTATVLVNYYNFKNHVDSAGEVIGCKCTQISESNPNGSLPNMLIDKLGKAQS